METIPADSPLDDSQQRRILDAVLAGPVVDLLGQVARRLPKQPKNGGDATGRVAMALGRLQPMQVAIPLTDESSPMELRWPASALTWDDRRRLATMGNTTGLSMNRLVHHAVRIAHHLFRSVILEIMTTSERTGSPVRDLLAAAIAGDGDRDRAGGSLRRTDAALPPDASAPTVAMAATREAAMIADPEWAATDEHGALAAEAAHDGPTLPPISPHSMAKRTATPAPTEGVTESRIEDLENEMQRLRETIDSLRDSIDEFREDLVHVLRNLPDQLPPPVHIHSLPLDPTAADFGERVNAVPQEVMARLREEAARGRKAEAAVAVAAEGGLPRELTHGAAGNDHRGPTRQGKLFGWRPPDLHAPRAIPPRRHSTTMQSA